MKVILKQEVDNLGLPGDVVSVADGYGRNFLIPRGLAILATRGAMKDAEALTRARKAREARTIGSAAGAKDALEARTLRVPARVDDKGHLYGSVSVNDVVRVLRERGHQIEKRRVDLKGAIKQIGTYEIPVRVHPQVTATLTIDVVDEEGVVTVESLTRKEPIPPLPGEAAEAGDETIVEKAIEAAEELEAAEVAEDVEAVEAAEDIEASEEDAEASALGASADGEAGSDLTEEHTTDT